MSTVTVRDAKAKLTALLRRVEEGEEIVIVRDGKPIARLVGPSAPKARRKPGFWKGRFRTPDDFNAPLPDDLLDAFEGRP